MLLDVGIRRHSRMMPFDNILDLCILSCLLKHANKAMKIRTPLEVGLVIRERRRELNLTQAALAYKIGAGRQWISAVERGKSGAELGLVLRTLRALGLAFSIDTGKHLPHSGDSIPPIDIDAVIRAATHPSS